MHCTDGVNVKKRPARDRGASFKFGGVEVYVRQLTKMQSELKPLYAIMPANTAERKLYAAYLIFSALT